MIPLYWYRGFNNFGDRLSRFLVESVTGQAAFYSERPPRLLALGSILPMTRDGDLIWGAGAWRNVSPPTKHLHVFGVRGPLTRQLLLRHGIDCPEVYGDPALLLPQFYSPTKRKSQGVTVLRHYRDDWFPHGGDHSLSVADNPFDLIDSITSSEILVTSTLHGLIIAEAYGVPVVLLRNHRHAEVEPQFKYADYFASTGRDDLTQFDLSLSEAVKHPLPPPVLPDLNKLVEVFPRDLTSNASTIPCDHGQIENLAHFIKSTTNGRQVKAFLRSGDGGDALVNVGMLHLFDSEGISLETVPENSSLKGQVVLFGGGGNYVPYYDDCKRWIHKNMNDNRCVVLPQTIDDDSVRNISFRSTLICREFVSYEFCRRYAPCDVFHHQDLAFYLNPEKLGISRKEGDGVLHAFRSDIESAWDYPITPSADPALKYRFAANDLASMVLAASAFLCELNEFREIVTDRLHVAVGASLLGKPCVLFPDACYKNKAVYDYSFKEKSTVRWGGDHC